MTSNSQDGKNGKWLKLEKLGLRFQASTRYTPKLAKILVWLAFPGKIHCLFSLDLKWLLLPWMTYQVAFLNRLWSWNNKTLLMVTVLILNCVKAKTKEKKGRAKNIQLERKICLCFVFFFVLFCFCLCFLANFRFPWPQSSWLHSPAYGIHIWFTIFAIIHTNQSLRTPSAVYTVYTRANTVLRLVYRGNTSFSHNVMAAILADQNKETATMLMDQDIPRGMEFCLYAIAVITVISGLTHKRDWWLIFHSIDPLDLSACSCKQ